MEIVVEGGWDWPGGKRAGVGDVRSFSGGSEGATIGRCHMRKGMVEVGSGAS